jgi:hypothetical protein
MARLHWNQPGQNRYEFGVDRGVFYGSDDLGVVWNGLINVVESDLGGERESQHYDGTKYLDTISPKIYQATVSALTVPRQVLEALGEKAVVPGFILTRQSRSRFGLSYRTFMGQDVGYKIHIVYNAVASPTKRDYPTIADSVSPSPREWRIDAVPPRGGKYRPTAHFIIDSAVMSPMVLQMIEDYLYGTDTTPAKLPSIETLKDLILLSSILGITPDSVGGLADLVPGGQDLYRISVLGIHRALPQTRLIETDVLGLYQLE